MYPFFWLSSLPAQFCLDYAWLSALTLSFLCISFIFYLQLRPPSLASPLHVEGVSFGGVKLCRLDESSGPPYWFYEPTVDESDHDPEGAFPVSQFKRSRPKGLAPKTVPIHFTIDGQDFQCSVGLYAPKYHQPGGVTNGPNDPALWVARG